MDLQGKHQAEFTEGCTSLMLCRCLVNLLLNSWLFEYADFSGHPHWGFPETGFPRELVLPGAQLPRWSGEPVWVHRTAGILQRNPSQITFNPV